VFCVDDFFFFFPLLRWLLGSANILWVLVILSPIITTSFLAFYVLLPLTCWFRCLSYCPCVLFTMGLFFLRVVQYIYTLLLSTSFPATGVAMGSPLSDTLAEIFIQELEQNRLKHVLEGKKIIYYNRYPFRPETAPFRATTLHLSQAAWTA
jgi:hypothetical protein